MNETKQTSEVGMKGRARRSRSEWAKVVDKQGTSRLSAKRFCERESIGLASFYQWRRRLADESTQFGGGRQKESSFLDIGHLESTGGDAAVMGSGFELTLELGGGLNLVLRRS